MANLYTFMKDCEVAASRLGDYQAMTVTELADGYCDAVDTDKADLQNSYMSALILRYWYKINRLFETNPTLNLQREDYVNMLFEAIKYACKYRAWRTGKCVSASQAIQTTISTNVKNYYYDSNLQKNSPNFTTVSIDALEDDEDGNSGSRDWLESRYADKTVELSSAEAVVQTYLNKYKIVQAIILDCIAFGESNRESKKTIKKTRWVTKKKKGSEEEELVEETYKYNNYYQQFAKFSVPKIISELPSDYQQYFLEKYKVKKEIFEAGLNAIKTANNQKIYKFLTELLQDIRSKPEVIEMLRG